MSGFEGQDVRTMVMFGLGEDAQWWVDENKNNPREITRYVLFTAAQFGQLGALKKYIQYGDLMMTDDDKQHYGWNLYHYAVYGYQMNCSYLLNEPDPTASVEPHLLPKTPDEARKIQLDIIYALHKAQTPTGLVVGQEPGLEEDVFHQPPLHPSLMALGYESNFSEAALLIDMLAVMSSDMSVAATPGMDNINVTTNNDHRRALYHLVEWAYSRGYLEVLTFCHDRYLSLCSDSLRLRDTNYPIFLDAIREKRLEIIEMVFTHQDKRPLPDRILSKTYQLGKEETSPKINAVGVACDMCLQGRPDILHDMLRHTVISVQLVNLSLSELGITEVPLELFHPNLRSLALSQNKLSHFPPVKKWQCQNLAYFNMSSNEFIDLPLDLFSLPKLLSLNASNNRIKYVDKSMWTAPCLKTLFLSSNEIDELPYPEIGEELEATIQSVGLLSPSDVEREVTHSIRHGFIDTSAERDEDYHANHLGYNLEFLDVSENNLTSLPKGLACLAPMLLTLKLNNNKIKDFGNVSDYPTLLKSLELTKNGGKMCITHRPSIPRGFICLQSSPDQPKRCTHSDHFHLANLQHLNLSKNELEEVVIEVKTPTYIALPHPGSPILEEGLLYPKVHSLFLNDNNLTRVPVGIHKLERLGTLDISNNPRIKELPRKLHLLKNLIGFRLKGIGDPIISTLETFKDTAQLLYYLRARETDAIDNRTMRLFLIGHCHKGKTTILKTLQGEKPKIFRFKKEDSLEEKRQRDRHNSEKDTVGIECGVWQCTKKRTNEAITFYTWDFAGQDEYYVTHQCFLTNRALYLLVWKVTDKEHGIEGLSVWLRNLHAAAPYAQVIIVGTHLDEFRRKEGKNTEQLLQQYRNRILQEYSSRERTAPKIHKIIFVGFSESIFPVTVGPFSADPVPQNYDQLHDTIFDVANNMELPQTPGTPATLHMKLIEEKIPRCYLELDKVISGLAIKKPIYKRSEFCDLECVRRIISDDQEVDAAINFLHNMGRVLHFPKPLLEDYYILNPQWWFDACALVISPNNVSNLVTAGADPGSGLLKFSKMQEMFQDKGYDQEYASLIFSFLHQYDVLLPVDKETALVPSMISPIPVRKLFTNQGAFPRGNFSYEEKRPNLEMFARNLPAACRSLESDIQIQSTGLVYRRMFLLPPLPAGFWSKLINLCLQKNDFVKIISGIENNRMYLSGWHGLYYDIGSRQVRWMYWKTGIVLFFDDKILLSINSLKTDEFIDPLERAVVSATNDKVKLFHFADEGGVTIPVTQFNEVIEVVVPEVNLVSPNKYDNTVSAKLLAKALEMIDEVLKGHCEQLAENGIYTIGDMLHVVPCPICFGEKDCRETLGMQHKSQYQRLSTRLRAMSAAKPQAINTKIGNDVIIVFSIDQCIRSSMTSNYIQCPKCKDIALEFLVPDITFNDLSKMKIDRTALRNPPESDGSPIGSGCFGVVYHKIMQMQYNFDAYLEVAVKEFRSTDMDYDAELEVVKSYADMRYELNKLSTLEHNFVVKFVGLLTNPSSFILEWAPLMSLERIRKCHEEKIVHFCPVSLYLVLLQVTDGLHYLHTPPIGIIHSDLKLSNILAFRFPKMDHQCCYDEQDCGRCSVCLPEHGGYEVLVKLGDMGVCVNPAAHNIDTLGVKRFAPECLRFDSKITEKVDIFCLALCLHELMTLRGLPPRGLSEQDYKTQIKRNWRPPFHSKDPPYPLPLYLCLEQCWEQDFNTRPSALTIKNFLENVTGLHVKKNFQLPAENMCHFLDAYQISTDSSVTHIALVPDREPLTFYVALKQESSSQVITAESCYDGETNRMVFKTSIIDKSQEGITALYVSSDMTIFIGREGGSVLTIRKKEPPQQITVNCCGQAHHHGNVIFIRYIQPQELLVLGCSDGYGHFVKANLSNLSNGISSCYCANLQNFTSQVNVYEMIHKTETSLEVWCGCNEAAIEVWEFPLSSQMHWRQTTVNRTTCLIKLDNIMYTPPTSTVSKMTLSPNESTMFVLIRDKMRHSSSVCQIDVTTRQPLKYWQSIKDVSSFSMTSNELLIGTETGHSVLVSLDSLKSINQVVMDTPSNLTTHLSNVSGIFVMSGEIKENGYSSIFPTYFGQHKKKIACRFMVSIGQGCLDFQKFNPKASKNLVTLRNGTYLSVWLI